MGTIGVYTGDLVDPLHLHPQDIDIRDIARSLSMTCRWRGHVSRFYSVAEHSIHVAHLCGAAALHGLLHDAAETYLCDCPAPIKRQQWFSSDGFIVGARQFYEVERDILKAVCYCFEICPTFPPEVTLADRLMLVTEARALTSHAHHWIEESEKDASIALNCWTPEEAEREFLREFAKWREYRV